MKQNKSLRKKFGLYSALNKVPPNLLNHVITHLDDQSIDDICECVYNLIYTDLSLSSKQKRKLQKNLHKHCCIKNLKVISSKGISVSKRRKALQQEGTGLGLIFSTIVPLLAKLFS